MLGWARTIVATGQVPQLDPQTVHIVSFWTGRAHLVRIRKLVSSQLKARCYQLFVERESTATASWRYWRENRTVSLAYFLSKFLPSYNLQKTVSVRKLSECHDHHYYLFLIAFLALAIAFWKQSGTRTARLHKDLRKMLHDWLLFAFVSP